MPSGSRTAATTCSIGRITTAGVVSHYTDPKIFGPAGITAGPDGALWFTNFGNNSVGRITTAGVVTVYTGPPIEGPRAITAGPDGALWFANYDGSSISRISTAGVVTGYTNATVSEPLDITTGPDGALWFTSSFVASSSIGRITTAGVITTYTDPTIRTPAGITVGPDGALWFTDVLYPNTPAIGRITTAGVVSTYTGAGISRPQYITTGPDGALWFTNNGNNSIGRITTAGVVTNYTDSSIDDPLRIVAGPDGALWFTNANNNSIGRITTAGVVTNFTDPSIVEPIDLTAGPDGALWFTNFGNNSIGRITTAGWSPNYAAAGFNLPADIVTGSDGALWITNYGINAIARFTPPTTSVVIPSSGAALRGSQWLDAGASSAANVTNVEFRLTGGALSNALVATGSSTIYGWLGLWNTTTVPDGSYTLDSVATDAAGSVVSSVGVPITVDNTPPTRASWSHRRRDPNGGQWLDCGASDNVGVTKVEFRLTGGSYRNALVTTGTLTSYGWLGLWDTSTVPDGAYALTCVAFDAAGNSTTSAGVGITTSNALAITTNSLPNGKKSTAYSATLAASGGHPPITWTLTGGKLPRGLALNGSTAVDLGHAEPEEEHSPSR